MKLSLTFGVLSARLVQALPAPQNAPPVANQPGLPGGTSGSIRGSESLLGFNSANSVSDEPSTVIPPSDFELAPGQSDDAELGLYLDLTNVKDPQPIRGGTTGPTDPGPRFASR
jgi:hypothetical protein